MPVVELDGRETTAREPTPRRTGARSYASGWPGSISSGIGRLRSKASPSSLLSTSSRAGEAAIRRGLLHERWPATFPSGEGSDLAGVVEEVRPGVDSVAVGDEVIGWTDQRGSHAELVVVSAGHLTPKPPGVSWEAAGALFVAGATAYAAVRAVGVSAGDTVVVSGAAGGVGSITVQLAARRVPP
jgi:Zn-dependent alcohol dehydrogenase